MNIESIKDRDATLKAVLEIVRDAQVIGLSGQTNLPAVRCQVDGLSLGHWQRLWAAIGDDALAQIKKP